MSSSPRYKASLKLSAFSSTSPHAHHQSVPAASASKAAAAAAGSCDHRLGRRSEVHDDEERRSPLQTSDRTRSKASGSPQECSMCGDIGFPTELFQCKKCLHRLQHTYCSKYYPSIPNLEVCDWCSQDSNPSAGSSSATTNTTMSGMKARITKLPASLLVTNLGKRKVIAAAADNCSPSSSSPRSLKNSCSDAQIKLNNNNSVNLKAQTAINNNNNRFKALGTISTAANPVRNSNNRRFEEEHKDALELLLEVAQKVAEGQMMNTWSGRDGGIGVKKTSTSGWENHRKEGEAVERRQIQNLKQQQVEKHNNNNNSVKRESAGGMTAFHNTKASTIQGSMVLSPGSSKRQKLEACSSPAGVVNPSVTSSVKQVGEGERSGGQKDHNKLQLTSSRSIGRRYKLLSDVLCQKLAASNS